MIGNIGLPELIVIFLVIFLLFGAKALPEVAKGLAQAIKTFKKEVREMKQGVDSDQAASSATPQPSDSPKSVSHDFDPNENRRDWRPPSEESSDQKEA